MHVLVDATAIPADRGGVGRYLDELLPELLRAGTRLTVVCQSRDEALFRSVGDDASLLEVRPQSERLERRPVRLLWEQTGLPRLIKQVKPDVVLSPHYTMPLLTRTPVTVTFHDATFFTTPEVHLPTKGRFFRTWIRLSARRADTIVTPSKATRDEVVRLTGADPEKFYVAYHGVDHTRFFPVDQSEQARVRETLDIGDGYYVGFLGTLEPRKNVPALIRAWVKASEQLAHPPALVLAGGKGWDTALDEAVAAVPSQLTIRLPGYLPLDDLPGFLAGAKVLAYPSLGEGFGLPVLEAMACGATVLTTRELSLPEVGGEAVAYCNTDEASIAKELLALLNDDARRAALSAAAIDRASTFTWAQAAADHIEAFSSAIA